MTGNLNVLHQVNGYTYKLWHISSRHTAIQQQKRSKLLTQTKRVNCRGNAERKKSVIYRMISFITIFTKRYNYNDSRQFSGCQWLKVRERCTYEMKAQDVFWVIELMFLNLDCGGGYIQIYSCVKIHRIPYSIPRSQFYLMPI